jgi:hypothetical protein
MRLQLLFGLTLFLVAGWLAAQEEGEKLKSGLQKDEVLPGPFDAFNVNGKKAKGRQHCLVCENGLHPVVLVFAREPAEGKDGPLTALLAKLDEAVSRHADGHFLGSFAVFLSPHALNSANNAEEKDTKKIVEETIARDALIKRLEGRAENLKNVVIACYPAEGPKDYKINPKAEVTVLFYKKHKVLANFSYPEEKLTEAEADKIVKTVDEALANDEALAKKKPGKK